jgi:glutaminase
MPSDPGVVGMEKAVIPNRSGVLLRQSCANNQTSVDRTRRCEQEGRIKFLHIPIPFHEMTTVSAVSTGELPTVEVIESMLNEVYDLYRVLDEGAVANYIPALANADPSLFGVSISGVGGRTFSVGEADHLFSVQSISKAFVFALVCEAIGHETAHRLLGVNATGLAFNSVMAIELNDERTMNPMVNAGAMATTSLVPGTTTQEKWEFIREGLSLFAGRQLDLDKEVYASESATNLRNQGIAHLLQSYGRLHADPDEITDIYTRQCSLLVSAADLALMGATLANGGVNPMTGHKVISSFNCKHVLAALATAGLYEHSGDWLYQVGLPGKSGVSGGIVTISPGKGGLGTFSPPLDQAGNSVRGQLATRYVSEKLGLNIFASKPVGVALTT